MQDDSFYGGHRLVSPNWNCIHSYKSAIRTPACGFEISSYRQRVLSFGHNLSVEGTNPGLVPALDAFLIQGELPDRKRRKVAGREMIYRLSGLQGNSHPPNLPLTHFTVHGPKGDNIPAFPTSAASSCSPWKVRRVTARSAALIDGIL